MRLLVATAVACVLTLAGSLGCSRQSSETRAAVRPSVVATTLPPASEGLAFVRDGRSFVIRDGSPSEIAADGVER